MNYIEDKFQQFINCDDYSNIAKYSVQTAQMTQLMHFIINSYGVPCYPKFRNTHKTVSGLKVYNLKIQYPARDDWDNIATIHPHKNFLEVFTFKNGHAQESYFINTTNRECTYNNQVVPLENLLEEIHSVYKLRSNE